MKIEECIVEVVGFGQEVAFASDFCTTQITSGEGVLMIALGLLLGALIGVLVAVSSY